MLKYKTQWQRDFQANGLFKNIPRANLTTYAKGGADVGHRIRSAITTIDTNNGQTTTVFTLPTAVIKSAPSTGGGSTNPSEQYLPSVARVRDRIAYGGPADEAEITAMGVQAYIERQLNPTALTDAQARKYSSYPIGFDLVDYPTVDDLGPQPLDVARMIGRKDALKSGMHEFWINHLVPGYRIRNTFRLPSFTSLKEVFYNQGMGNFEVLLTRFIMSVPLQYFMDNYLNVYGSVNENLGREVLELFALGIPEDATKPARYDQVIDVAELTRLLTGHGVLTFKNADAGRRIDNDPRHIRGSTNNYVNTRDPDTGVFTYNQNSQTAWFYPAKHDPDIITFTFLKDANGEKIKFSNAIDGAGVEGYAPHPSLTKFIRLLVRHRPSAEFMCNKIAIWFLGCPPSDTLLNKMIDKWLEQADSPTQIAQVLRILFFSSDFTTDYATGRRALTPLTWYSKLINYFGENYFSKKSILIIKGYCEKEEYITGTYQTPAGFPDLVDYWLSPGHLTERGDKAETICPNGGNNNSDFCVDYVSFLRNNGLDTPRKAINHAAHYFLADRASSAQIAVLANIFGSTIDTTVDWSVSPHIVNAGKLYRSLALIDISHYAA